MKDEITDVDFKLVKDFMMKHYQYFIMGIIIIYGLLYKIELLDFPRDFWHDEAFQFLYAQNPISFIINSMDVHPPLFNLISKGIISITSSELGIRYFIVFLSLIMLITSYFYVSRVFGKTEAFISCAIFSTFATWVFYATEFRSYMFVLMIIPLQMYFFYKYYEHGWRMDLVYCMLISVTLLYTHYFTALVFLGQGLFFIIKKKIETFKMLSTALVGCLLCLPLVVYFLNTIPKIESFWFKEITFKSLISTFAYLLFPNPSQITTLFTIIFYIVFISIFVKVFFRKTINDKTWLLISQGFFPIVFLYIISQFHPIYHHRYFLFGGMSIIILFAVVVVKLVKQINKKDNKYLALLLVSLLIFVGGTIQSSDDFNFELRDSSMVLKNVIESDMFNNNYVIVHTSTFSQSPYKVYFKDNKNVKNLLLTNLTEKQLFTAGGSVIEKEEVIRTKESLPNYNATVYFVSDEILGEKIIWEEGGLYVSRDKNYAELYDEKWNILNE